MLVFPLENVRNHGGAGLLAGLVQVGVDVGGGGQIRVSQVVGHVDEGYVLADEQACEGVPLRYNKDKRKNPVFSRVSAFVVAYSIPFPTLIVNEKSVE